MTAQAPVLRTHGNSYNIFILVLTIFSLAIMVLLLLPLDPDTRQLLTIYDNAICVIFLIDFAMNMAGSKPKRGYFIGQRGWLDLVGSIPSIGVFQLGALFRLARLSRLGRIGKLLSGKNRNELVADVLRNRGQYATFITILLAGMVLSVASVMVLQFESKDPEAKIHTGGEAIWWGIVTLTTVGYGDYYPVTMLGRLTAIFVMFSGIGIIGALASILASLLVAPSTPPEPDAAKEAPTTDAKAPAAARAPAADAATAMVPIQELADIRAEIAALRQELASARSPSPD